MIATKQTVNPIPGGIRWTVTSAMTDSGRADDLALMCSVVFSKPNPHHLGSSAVHISKKNRLNMILGKSVRQKYSHSPVFSQTGVQSFTCLDNAVASARNTIQK